MKTRIIHTKIFFEDDWFYNLTIPQKFIFIYLITNSHIGLSGIYELPKRIGLLETGVTDEEWVEACRIYENKKKILFSESWVYIVNATRYAQYTGGKNLTALNKELSYIPYKVFKEFSDTVSIPYPYPIDTLINHKSEIINQKPEIKNQKEGMSEKGLEKLREKIGALR